MKINPAYVPNIYSNFEKQIIFLPIPNKKEGWHYLTLKTLAALLKRINSYHNDDFYCLYYLHSLRTENKLKSHEKVCKNKDFCEISNL